MFSISDLRVNPARVYSQLNQLICLEEGVDLPPEMSREGSARSPDLDHKTSRAGPNYTGNHICIYDMARLLHSSGTMPLPA